MDKDKKWDRKEVVTVDPGSLLSAGVDVHLYGKKRLWKTFYFEGKILNE